MPSVERCESWNRPPMSFLCALTRHTVLNNAKYFEALFLIAKGGRSLFNARRWGRHACRYGCVARRDFRAPHAFRPPSKKRIKEN